MDLKSDNRKRFQDKQKLKRKHATPSDRKYRQQAKLAEKEAEEKEEDDAPLPLPSNEERYTRDVLQEIQDKEFDPQSTIDKLKQKWENSDNIGGEDTPAKTPPTRKRDILNMDAKQLNKLLGKTDDAHVGSAEHIKLPHQGQPREPLTGNGNVKTNKPAAKTSQSLLPEDLGQDQDFLDDLL
ncbi:uncharacterized protein KNAG_0D02800 [Huiozyma naganishii CBS 8797]|uniref:Uncharacterized protein n=1 Tax=Huiozyma naganishii (strain ATCC MYA-139 / BCRC 22969 / CBS 8797 / KCTC 17520 / NBRC 10181 / NCYC 3082 / Yp74L-3) TaxID=1071383 RepID=J7S5V5_HUIN7|nr:hypothetical protein KNAG_0D02800 [Kazachstania naganishii CBS 8797]CCK70029.1 hypothetical protein KNAG_0D02800 [Kazachstania naganishii CBS 8797]